ncbi:hypothetical protein AK830_g9661 [Neonectria ditissima]|uniref:Zn(2)-C6 fungal-type domain-containing protein n=1 Tax=Neonectria ditissima TaxID=78410 RepID=A0A0P7BC01_9HYPO|nr:hypothetical protein AK830_g9661 [Neonectria ditissima]
MSPVAESAGPGSGSGPSPRLRRAHRKSRNGCRECKRRHIKCDMGFNAASVSPTATGEAAAAAAAIAPGARPPCSNCAVSERTCVYPPTAPVSAPSRTQQQQQPSTPAWTTNSPAESPAESTTSSAGAGVPPAQHPHPPPPPMTLLSSNPSTAEPGSLLHMILVDDAPPATLPSLTDFFGDPMASGPDPAPPESVFTAKHLALLHHAQTACPFGTDMMRPIIDLAMAWAYDAPYALDQMLTLSADHLAATSPDDAAAAAAHRHTATELQARALMCFNRKSHHLASERYDETFIPRFLFASLLSVHVLYETFSHPQFRASYHVFMDRFLESIHLHRGVRTVIDSKFRINIETSLRPFLVHIKAAEAAITEGGTECVQLARLIDASDLGPATVAACKSAAHSLQWAFNIHANLASDNNVHAATAFPTLLTSEFVDALRKHRPEALLVLAHYGVLLHRCRRSWIVGDAGAFLIRLIANYLGNFWQEPMQWPLEELNSDQG